MVRETWVQSQVAIYKILWKLYLIPPCLTLSNIRSVSRVKWSNPGKGVSHLGVVAIEKGAFWSPSTKGRQPHLILHDKVKYFEYVSIQKVKNLGLKY